MKELIIITGKKGSGKTTLAMQLLKDKSFSFDSFKKFKEFKKYNDGCFIVELFETKDFLKLKEIITRDEIKNIKIIIISNADISGFFEDIRHFDYVKTIKCYKQ